MSIAIGDSNLCDQPEIFHCGSSPSASGSSSSLCRNFWKAGDYEVAKRETNYRAGENHLRVHPKFLHSNATSHKWVFGAIAELLDNAVDEVVTTLARFLLFNLGPKTANGATFVILDRILDLPCGCPALLVQDDGGGMDPESMRRCMSFGFSDKDSASAIGQYGNGFKTSTMRLGADVIVFSRCMKNGIMTQSVGLLSYTFLRLTGSDDIVVPMVDYVVPKFNEAPQKLLPHGEKYFSSNLSAILKWSPFTTEADLLMQFDGIGNHGTKIIIFNLWLNDDGVLELDFDSDPSDIMTSGAPKKLDTRNMPKRLTQEHIANRLRYSLQAYSSILYLHVPQNFRIILRGNEVQPYNLVSDLSYIECIKYTPNVAGSREATFITTIGFLNGAPHLNIHGFNVYHRNRLILPFWRVVNSTNSKGRGVSGVLEANFIKPTHDKQDFEKSTLFFRLESRLKEMTLEYWDYHCHLVGYPSGKLSHSVAVGTSAHPNLSSATGTVLQNCGDAQVPLAGKCVRTPYHTSASFPTEQSNMNHNNITSSGSSCKRKNDDDLTLDESLKRQAQGGDIAVSHECHRKIQRGQEVRRKGKEVLLLMQEQKKLQAECRESEKLEKELNKKVEKLRSEIEETKRAHRRLLMESESLNKVKSEIDL